MGQHVKGLNSFLYYRLTYLQCSGTRGQVQVTHDYDVSAPSSLTEQQPGTTGSLGPKGTVGELFTEEGPSRTPCGTGGYCLALR